MSADTDSPNQLNSQNIQNFNIDIDKIYSDFIQQIDSVRSFVNITSPQNQQLFNNFTEEKFNGLDGSVKIETEPQESRCHAFFRLVGFPVASKGFDKYFSPGLDNIKDPARQIKKENKISIANTPIDKFNDLSLKRELYFSNKLAKIFLDNLSIDAAVWTLSSYNIRKFNYLFDKTSGIDDTNIDNQSYVIDLKDSLGLNLLHYTDRNGMSSTTLVKDRSHIIKPFLVDARINFSIKPSANLVSIPFPITKSNTMITDNVFVKRPLIEKIIRERYDISNQLNTIGQADKDLVAYLKTVTSIKDDEIIQKINSGNVYELSSQQQFVKFLRIIQTMMAKLVNAQRDIGIVQSQYYYVPVPAKNGPEGGCSSQPVFIKDPNGLMEIADQEIVNFTVQSLLQNINYQNNSSDQVDKGDNVPDDFALTFNTDTSEAFGDNVKESLTSLNNTRTSVLNIGNSALKTIEIIMGEFSGLGLCDIIAILGGLYLVEKKYLLGLIDVDAFNRGAHQIQINDTQPGLQESLQKLEDQIKDFYNIMDKIYKDQRQSSGLA